MKTKVKLEEEIEFWLGYISNWEGRHNEPIPERAQLLLENALLKLESHYPDKKQALPSHLRTNNRTLH